MTPSLWTKVATIIALLAHGPALAESTGQHIAARVAQIASSVPEAANTAGVDTVSAGEGTEVKFIPPVKRSSVSLETDQDSIKRFIHSTTIQPIMKVAQDAADWIASGSNAAAIAAKNTSQWIAESSNSVVNAARNTSDWIASSSNAVVLALQDAEKWAAERASHARNTSEWVASNSSAAVFAAQDTGEWIAASSGAAINLVIDVASHTFYTFSTLEDWSANLVRHVESHLRADPTSEFAVLVRESGFALTDVKVGVGLIPDLTVEFRHERDLDPTEIQAFKTRVDAYARNAAGPVGYFEGLLLRRLLKAGEYSGGMRISEVHVDVFPLPGLQVFFDPFGFEEEENKMLVDAYGMAQAETTDLKSIEERISKIEAILSAPQIKK